MVPILPEVTSAFLLYVLSPSVHVMSPDLDIVRVLYI